MPSAVAVDQVVKEVFDEPSRWRAEVASSVGLTGLELCQALGAGPAYPSSLHTAIAAIEAGEDDLVVDVGSGIGATTEVVRQFTGAFVIGVEPVPGSTEASKQLFPSNPVLAGSAGALPLADGVARGVVLNGVVSLLDDLAPVLLEIRRVLRDGGVVAITDLFLAEGEERRIEPNTFRSLPHLARHLERAGLAVVDIGVGSTAPRSDWSTPQRALDELVAEEYGARPEFRTFRDDQRHLAEVVASGALIGGCLAARRLPHAAP